MYTEPQDFPRRLLVCVTGLSPQVVTETLYALAVGAGRRFLPTEVHLLSTAEGAERARLSLLSDTPGWFARLCRDYTLSGIRFDADCIHTLRDSAGTPLADIRELGDNERAADTITERIRAWTADPNLALHVSVAGGRKTMGIYAASALALYGRDQDRLSHVLVAAPFESHPDFYYPSPESRIIYTAPPDSRPLDTRSARVTLAEIPFVRLRHGLPEKLLRGTARYSEAVSAAQRRLGPPTLIIDLAARRVRAGDELLRLRPAQLALLAWLAGRKAEGKKAPCCPPEGAPDPEYAREYLALYRAILGELGDDARSSRRLAGGMEKAFFEQARSKLNRQLKDALGADAEPYLIRGTGRRPGLCYAPGVDRRRISFGPVKERQT